VAVSNKPKQNLAHPNIKIQPPLLALSHVVLAFLLTWLIPLPLSVPPVLQTVGFLLVILGFLLGVAALIAFRRASTTLRPRGRVAHLVTSGIYGFTRNPVYLGFLFIMVGISLDSGSYWGIILAPIWVLLFNQLVIHPEEEYLASRFSEQFTLYKGKVRRWL
jgi:protein-S-isoprenylcysteine O-methyltransferase Ste14